MSDKYTNQKHINMEINQDMYNQDMYNELLRNLDRNLGNRLYNVLKKDLLSFLVEKIDRDINNLEQRIYSHLKDILENIEYNFKNLNDDIDTINSHITDMVKDEIENSKYQIKNYIYSELNNNPNLSKVGKRQQISKDDIQKIKHLRSMGYSYSQIRKETKWSNFTIGRVLNGEYDNKDLSINSNNYISSKINSNYNKNICNKSIKKTNKLKKIAPLNEKDNRCINNYNSPNIEKNNTCFENLKPNISERNDLNNQADIEGIRNKLEQLEQKKNDLIHRFSIKKNNYKMMLNEVGLKTNIKLFDRGKSNANEQQIKDNDEQANINEQIDTNKKYKIFKHKEKTLEEKDKLYSEYLLFIENHKEEIKELDKEINELKTELKSYLE